MYMCTLPPSVKQNRRMGPHFSFLKPKQINGRVAET